MNADVLILAAEEAGGEGIDLLIPTIPELVGGILAFAVVFVVMWKFAWPQLQELLENRQKAIAGQIQEAEAIKAEAQSLLDDYRQQVAGAKSEANQIVEAARTQADTVKADLIAKAQTEAESIVGKAREDASSEKSRAMTEARQEVANLSIDLAEKVVGNSLDRAAQQSLVDSYLANLEGA
ncbi:MAG: F0F1 ATP synthase subunit B [Acidimicrobiia bacterium]|nr:F0F1 ATP synthase subunit B [Acidimicrobiia bacterium]MDH5420555.1 F0F1 ATP synthase subunit B [Acidimicrobiia bacterium]MDH5503857.1 F0F1 ATP synthase subunit B [Acidimicrobiia bacterium]